MSTSTSFILHDTSQLHTTELSLSLDADFCPWHSLSPSTRDTGKVNAQPNERDRNEEVYVNNFNSFKFLDPLQILLGHSSSSQH